MKGDKMLLVEPNFNIIEIADFNDHYDVADLSVIEEAGRICYKSKPSRDDEARHKFIKQIIDRGHESVIEHSMMTVHFICDRGVSHELVRHRLCAFSQESTRYCNYKSGVTFVIPPWVDISIGEYDGNIPGDEITGDRPSLTWYCAMLNNEQDYLNLLQRGWTPQQARSVLPNSLKTEIFVTANYREWRHIFKLRTAAAAHPQMREIMIPLLKECKVLVPVIFDDI
jgi:thymidylate synthase (FAD)